MAARVLAAKSADTTCLTADAGLARLAAAARSRIYEAGHGLFEQGDEFAGVYRLESGLVGIRKLDEDGSSMLLHLVQPGDFIGYGPLLICGEHQSCAEVLQTSRISFIDAGTMRALLRDEAAVARALLSQAARELSALDEKYLQMATRQAHARLAGLLATLASRAARSAAGSCTFELPILNRELAELIGIRPETLSRAIAQLRTLGLAQLDGRTVHVPSLANLSRIAGCHGDSYQPQPMAA